MAVEALDDIDLVKGTLRHLGRMKFQQIAQELTDYEVFPKWFKKDKVMFESGVGIQRTLLARLPDIARHVGWTDEDDYSIVDLAEQLQVPWRHATTSWMWKRQEILMNSGPEKIFDLVKMRRAAAMLDMVQKFEAAGWNAPSASTNKTDPFGMAYWIVKSTGASGYNGGIPSGHTTLAGLDLSTDATTFKNYTTTYSAFSQADCYAKLRTMKRKTGFKSPVAGSDYSSERKSRYRIYINEATMSAFELSLLAQNDQLGTKDVSPLKESDDGVTFKSHPVVYVPYLDASTDNPIYYIDHATFYPVVLSGDFLREDDPVRDTSGKGRHDWRIVHVDTSYNFLCVDRRRNGVAVQV